MTEPDVASSDPTNLETTAVRDGDDWVLNGRKWCITGADGAAFAIVVAKTGIDEAAGHRNYSLIIVPCNAPGWVIERHPRWMGSHAPGGHPFVALTDVRVPAVEPVGREARASATQQRLATGRLAYAMRWIGSRSARSTSPGAPSRAPRLRDRARRPPGAAVHDRRLRHGPARLAHDGARRRRRVDEGLPHRQEVAMAKTFVSEAFGRVDRPRRSGPRRRRHRHGPADRRLVPGRPGGTDYDGASEVHRMTIARELLRAARTSTDFPIDPRRGPWQRPLRSASTSTCPSEHRGESAEPDYAIATTYSTDVLVGEAEAAYRGHELRGAGHRCDAGRPARDAARAAAPFRPLRRRRPTRCAGARRSPAVVTGRDVITVLDWRDHQPVRLHRRPGSVIRTRARRTSSSTTSA